MAGSSGVPSRTGTLAATNGSMTITSTGGSNAAPGTNGPTLRLRAQSNAGPAERRIQWAEDVIDNEGMGKKSSKVCCIYHAPKNVDESGSDDSSLSSDSSDSEPDLSRAQPANRRSQRQGHHDHDQHGPDHASHGINGAKTNDKGKDRASSPNAYERVPKRKDKK